MMGCAPVSATLGQQPTRRYQVQPYQEPQQQWRLVKVLCRRLAA
jgi:hypothetical protein